MTVDVEGLRAERAGERDIERLAGLGRLIAWRRPGR